jgi:hypothetical protein
MAKATLGPTVVDMRGKLASVVYFRNRGGLCTRNYVKPTNPKTAKQVQLRDVVSTESKYWAATLTTSQRAAWATFARSITTTNSLGVTKPPSAWNAWMMYAVPAKFWGATQITTPPTSTYVPQPATFTITEAVAGSELVLAWTPASPGTGISALIWATKPIPVTYTNIHKFLSSIGGEAGTSPTPNIYSSYVSRITTPADGSFTGFALQFVNTTTWQRSRMLTTTVIWT